VIVDACLEGLLHPPLSKQIQAEPIRTGGDVFRFSLGCVNLPLAIWPRN
jgi:hypothetical protein